MNNKYFYIDVISDELMLKMAGKSFKDNCTVPREDLRHLHVLHKNLQGQELAGELVCNKHIAEAVLDIFQKLYEAGYPIERVRLVDEYEADDEMSMQDNNSSSFNFRLVSFTNRVSKHGLGLAVDVNPFYNPYIKEVAGKLVISPEGSQPYADRNTEYDYKIVQSDLCCQLFYQHGFDWGGDWDEEKDYQHFEIPTEQIRQWYPDY